MSTMRLPGLSPYNTAAHLALLGIMKILEEDCPDWQGGYWEKHATGWTPVLSLAGEKTEDDLCHVLAQGLYERAGIYQKVLEDLEETSCKMIQDDEQRRKKRGGKKEATGKLSQTPPRAFADAVRTLHTPSPISAELLCAFSAGLNMEGKISFSPLLLLEGANKDVNNLKHKKGFLQWKNVKKNIGRLRDTLFQNDWMRVDNAVKFNWDYEEWSNQARMGRDPNQESNNRVEWAASALAQVGFSGLGAFPMIVGNLRTKAPGWVTNKENKGNLSFPLWTERATYDSIHELLLANMFVSRNREQLEQTGVKQIVEMEVFLIGPQGKVSARKIASQGKFLW